MALARTHTIIVGRHCKRDTELVTGRSVLSKHDTEPIIRICVMFYDGCPPGYCEHITLVGEATQHQVSTG